MPFFPALRAACSYSEILLTTQFSFLEDVSNTLSSLKPSHRVTSHLFSNSAEPKKQKTTAAYVAQITSEVGQVAPVLNGYQWCNPLHQSTREIWKALDFLLF